MKEIQKGLIVRSCAGKDKGRFLVVIEVSGDYVYICDGRHRLLSNPKKKKLKHVAVTDTVISEDMYATNRVLKKSLNRFYV